MKIGRNQPCLCGSGLKFKRCCGRPGNGNSSETEPNATQEPAEDIRRVLRREFAGQEFESLEQAQSFASQLTVQRNAAPLDEFCGLSPEQMQALLYQPWRSPQLLRFTQLLPEALEAPVIGWLEPLLDRIQAERPKATANGNLPRKLCQDIAHACWTRERRSFELEFIKVRGEDDVSELHATRVIAQLAGFVRRYKGHFVVSKKCQSLRDEHGSAGLYLPLLHAAANEFNWGYRDGYPSWQIIQQSFAFSLLLLTRHSGQARCANEYATDFLRAFPSVLTEPTDDPSNRYRSEHDIARCYSLRMLDRFAAFFGLVSLEQSERDVLADSSVVVMPLLAQVVSFSDRALHGESGSA